MLTKELASTNKDLGKSHSRPSTRALLNLLVKLTPCRLPRLTLTLPRHRGKRALSRPNPPIQQMLLAHQIDHAAGIGYVRSPIHLAVPARVRRLQLRISIGRSLLVTPNLALPRHQTNPRAVRQPRVSLTVTIFWILQTRQGPPIHQATAQALSAPRSTLLLSSAPCAPSASLVLIIYDHICALTLMSVPSFAAYVARHSPASTIVRGTRVFTLERRNSYAAVYSKITTIGDAVGDSLALMLWAAISVLKLAVCAFDLCSRKRRKRRAVGTKTSNWTTAMACLVILCLINSLEA